MDSSVQQVLLSPAVLAVLGLCIGSFLNVVIHRLNIDHIDRIIGMAAELDAEIRRMEGLREVNPSVPQFEIDYLREQKQQLTHAIRSAQLRLEAVRVILAS